MTGPATASPPRRTLGELSPTPAPGAPWPTRSAGEREELRDSLLGTLEGASDILRYFPVASYVGLLRSAPERVFSSGLSAAVHAQSKLLLARYGTATVAVYNQVALLELMLGFDHGSSVAAPNEHERYFETVTRWIREHRDGDAFFQCANTDFAKVAAVCAGWLTPCGVMSGLPVARVSSLAAIPAAITLFDARHQRARLEFLAFAARRLRGRGWCVMHLDPVGLAHHAHHITPEVWADTVARIGEHVARVPEIDVVALGSWWAMAPDVGLVSPRLTHLRELALASGARIFPYGGHDHARRGALSTSATRRALFASGKYCPVSCLTVWPRRDLVDWTVRRRRANRRGAPVSAVGRPTTKHSPS